MNLSTIDSSMHHSFYYYCFVQNFADSRVRIKGRFVKKEEEKIALLMHVTDEKSSNASMTPTSGSAKKSTGKNKDIQKAPNVEDDDNDDIDGDEE